MKKKDILTYFLSGLIPLIIFVSCTFINNLVPFGNSILNVYDSYSQYPGMMMGLKNGLLNGNIFYSFNGGLGFNLFSSILYYGFSPINILHIFSNPSSYPYIFSYLIFLRIFLLGFTMSIYLYRKTHKLLNTIVFSTLFALMGFTSTYYYNYMWIDSIIILPLVMLGLDKLIEKNKPFLYILFLSLSIIINFYIGYMIGLFSIIYFIYKMIIKYDKKIIKTYIISTLFSILICSFVLLPAFFALISGKASLYNNTNLFGISKNGILVFMKLLSGTYERMDQSFYGPPLIYSGIISIVLMIYSFFNNKIDRKEKIANAIVILLFYLSFTFNILNYSWQMFQHPYWWESRFSFLFSFFIISLSSRIFENIEDNNFNLRNKVIISIAFIILCIIGLIIKKPMVGTRTMFTYIFFGLSILIFIEFMFLIDKKYFLPLIIAMTFLDVTINTYNSLKQNDEKNLTIYSQNLKETLPNVIEELNKINNNEFFRMELLNKYTSSDGLYFNYNGINYFNSLRNKKTINTINKLGIYTQDECYVDIRKYDPFIMSLLNIKYIYGNIDYFDRDNLISINEYPLSIGFISSPLIKNVKLNSDILSNKNNILNSLIGEEINAYTRIDNESFKESNLKNGKEYYNVLKKDDIGTLTYTYKSNNHSLLLSDYDYVKVYINDEMKDTKQYIEVNIGDKVKIEYQVYGKVNKDKIYFDLLDLDKYETSMKKLSVSLLHAHTNKNNHILEGSITNQERGYLFTSIPYEKGMKVYVDNKEIKPDIILDSFIGFDLDSGTHNIYIDYTPYGLKTGALISSISLVLTAFYLQKHKNHL